MGKRKIGEIYNKPIVEGDINLKTPNEIHKSELSGGDANSEITLNDIFNIHPYELIVKEYPYPCTYDGIRWDGFHPTRIETIATGVYVVSASYMNNRDFYFNKNSYNHQENGSLNVTKLPVDTLDLSEYGIEMYYCLVQNLSFLLLYGPKEYTDMLIDEMKQDGI